MILCSYQWKSAQHRVYVESFPLLSPLTFRVTLCDCHKWFMSINAQDTVWTQLIMVANSISLPTPIDLFSCYSVFVTKASWAFWLLEISDINKGVKLEQLRGPRYGNITISCKIKLPLSHLCSAPQHGGSHFFDSILTILVDCGVLIPTIILLNWDAIFWIT